MSRESSYEAVQRNAMIVWNEGKNFLELLKMDEVIRKHLSETELEGLFDISLHLKQIDVIFNRVFSEPWKHLWIKQNNMDGPLLDRSNQLWWQN